MGLTSRETLPHSGNYRTGRRCVTVYDEVSSVAFLQMIDQLKASWTVAETVACCFARCSRSPTEVLPRAPGLGTFTCCSREHIMTDDGVERMIERPSRVLCRRVMHGSMIQAEYGSTGVQPF
jgi:hypothetical protein